MRFSYGLGPHPVSNAVRRSMFRSRSFFMFARFGVFCDSRVFVVQEDVLRVSVWPDSAIPELSMQGYVIIFGDFRG